jgi:hypothetical protein
MLFNYCFINDLKLCIWEEYERNMKGLGIIPVIKGRVQIAWTHGEWDKIDETRLFYAQSRQVQLGVLGRCRLDYWWQTEQLRTEVDLADKRFPSIIRRPLSCFVALSAESPFKDAYEQKNEPVFGSNIWKHDRVMVGNLYANWIKINESAISHCSRGYPLSCRRKATK